MVNNPQLKEKVRELCTDGRFVHHKWYFQYHLEILERIINELKQYHPEARQEILDALVWFHDLKKIVKDQGIEPEEVLKVVGFNEEEIKELARLNEIETRHREIDLSGAEIEVKILASADAAAHLMGPFYPIYWYENPNMEIEELMNGDLEKLKRDWERKIVLPEVKKAFENRYKLVLEQRGVYPERFIL